jgi:hypothetical protein
LSLLESNVEKIVLIVSTGRTGTRAIAQHLDTCYEQVRALHEPPPTRFRLRRAANRFLCNRMTPAQLVKVLRGERGKMLAETTQAIYVESNPGLAGFMDVFADVFANFQILHVVRDPRTYIQSALDWGVFRGMKGFLADRLPFWLPKPDFTEPAGGLRWRDLTHQERLAWYWKRINEHLDRGAQLYPGRYMRMRYEELFARDGSGLARFVEWIGLPQTDRLTLSANSENVNASRPRQGSKWGQWTDEDKRAVLRFCAPMMRAYGYDLGADAALAADAAPGVTQSVLQDVA